MCAIRLEGTALVFGRCLNSLGWEVRRDRNIGSPTRGLLHNDLAIGEFTSMVWCSYIYYLFGNNSGL